MVKYFRYTGFLLAILWTISSCQPNGSGSKSTLPKSSGKYGEVLVVVDSTLENGPVGKQLEAIFFKALDGTPQREAAFRMSTVHPEAFKSILKRSRNLLKISFDPQNQNKIKIDRDVWASDQLLINIYANSEESILRILQKNEETIRDYFDQEELERLKKQYSNKPNSDLMSEIKEKYDLNLLLPPAFLMMENNDHSFWIKKEKQIGEHQIIQGLIYYTYPYTSDSTFQAEYMIESRNRITAQLIEGSRDSSFMQVYAEYSPVQAQVNLNGRYAIEYRGLWNMKNDFMGGPFIHYSWVDEKSNRVQNIDAFVYAPKFDKREYLRELEAIVYTINKID